jgi:hypothetical protein
MSSFSIPATLHRRPISKIVKADEDSIVVRPFRRRRRAMRSVRDQIFNDPQSIRLNII